MNREDRRMFAVAFAIFVTLGCLPALVEYAARAIEALLRHAA